MVYAYMQTHRERETHTHTRAHTHTQNAYAYIPIYSLSIPISISISIYVYLHFRLHARQNQVCSGIETPTGPAALAKDLVLVLVQRFCQDFRGLCGLGLVFFVALKTRFRG